MFDPIGMVALNYAFYYNTISIYSPGFKIMFLLLTSFLLMLIFLGSYMLVPGFCGFYWLIFFNESGDIKLNGISTNTIKRLKAATNISTTKKCFVKLKTS